MKIAIVHNDYGKFSGEEAVVRDHAELLTSLGLNVVQYRRTSAELKGIYGATKGFLSGIWNPFSQRDFACFLEAEKPDIVHIHNLYPLINPCILTEVKKRKIPVVMTVHNFRLFCPNGLFAVNHRICEQCAEKQSILPCLKKNCLASGFKTLGYALRTLVAQQKRWYLDNVDKFLCLTNFQKNKLISYGILEEKCCIIPNFISADWLKKAENSLPKQGSYVAYMGRLSEEKGINDILNSAKELPDIPFLIAGNGAEKYHDQAPENVRFVGYLTGNQQFEFMRNARILLVASRCYENFPTTLLQSMVLGIPALVPKLGGMPEIIAGAGEVFLPEELPRKVKDLFYNAELCQQYRHGALKKIKEYSPARCGKLLKETYESLV